MVAEPVTVESRDQSPRSGMTELRDLVPHVSTDRDEPDNRRQLLSGLVTPEWLSGLLAQSSPGAEVIAVRIGDIVSGASTKAFLDVTYAPGGNPGNIPDSLILKGGFEDYSERTAFTHHNEMRFYRDIAPMIALSVPDCYFAGVEPTLQRPVVIIENLNRKNVRFNTIFTPLTYPQVVTGLDSLARFHAQTWNSPELEPGGQLDWVVDTVTGEFGKIHDYFFQPEVWDRFIHKSQFTAVPMIYHDAGRVRAALQSLHYFQQTLGTMCVVHGDCHEGNTYLYPDGVVGFLDFQVKKVPWCQDATEFIVGTLDISTRRRWEADLLREYLRRLRGYGVDAPSFEEAFAAHRRQLFYGLFKWLINEQFWQIEAINTGNTARYAYACMDHGTLDLLLG
jgi:Ecdysteroid kinase-like family